MIHDLDLSLEKIIYEQGKINRNDIDISFESPTGDWSAHLSRPTINLWCFDIRENVRLRNPEISGSMVRGERTVRVTQPSRRYDLCYLVTAWVRKIEDEHQLLWRALAALAQMPQISPEMGIGAVREQPFNISLKVANMPEFQMSITDLWNVVNNQMHLGLILTATVALETGRGFESPLVFEQRLEVGQSEAPLSRTMGVTDGTVVRNSKSKKS